MNPNVFVSAVHKVPGGTTNKEARLHRLPSGQVVKLVPVKVVSRVKVPKHRTRRYDMRAMQAQRAMQSQALAASNSQASNHQGMYRKHQGSPMPPMPDGPTGWQGLSMMDKTQH